MKNLHTILVSLCGNDFTVQVDSGIEYFTKTWRDWERGANESTLFRFIKDHGDINGVFIDIGAWIGCATLAAAPYYSTVYTFEADPAALVDLRANIALNNFSNIQLKPNFVGDSERVISMHSVGTKNSSGSSMYHKGGLHSWDVEMIKLDSFIQKAVAETVPLVIKMDIEGAEYICGHLLSTVAQNGQLRALCLSLHPAILGKSVSGYGMVNSVRRRWKVFARTLRLYRVLCVFPKIHNSDGVKVPRLRLLWAILRHGQYLPADRELYFTR
jgi:FkbM family methyltransferase